jgi:hypothetical protein
MAVDKTTKPHYVSNKKLLEEMIKYTDACKIAKANNEQRPRVSNYIGECIYKIANGLSRKPNFIGYSYRDEMVADGIENCLCYLHNFNPEKSSNPFAYFTQIIYYAFLRRIQKEKKQLYIKHKSFETSIVMNTLVEMSSDDPSHYAAAYMDLNGKMDDLVNRFETRPEKKSPAKKGVEKFFEEGNDDVNE